MLLTFKCSQAYTRRESNEIVSVVLSEMYHVMLLFYSIYVSIVSFLTKICIVSIIIKSMHFIKKWEVHMVTVE